MTVVNAHSKLEYSESSILHTFSENVKGLQLVYEDNSYSLY